MSNRVTRKVSLVRKGDNWPTTPPPSIPASFDYKDADPLLVKADIKKRAEMGDFAATLDIVQMNVKATFNAYQTDFETEANILFQEFIKK